MSEQIKCRNQAIPAYSGITINITSPTLNAAPMQGYGEGANLNAVGINVAQEQQPQQLQQLYENRYASNQYVSDPYTSPSAYYSQAEVTNSISDKKDSHSNDSVSDKSKEVVSTEKTVIKENTVTNNKVDNNDYVNRDSSQGTYPAQYYMNTYNVPQSQPATVINQYGLKDDLNSEKQDLSTSQEIIEKIEEQRAIDNNLKQTGKKKRVVALTNEYIMSLENYLNNPNAEVRLMAAKDILTRLNEDRDRYDDAALNALLNKMLQDPSKLVRVAALSALSSDLASGNDYTVEILNQIQQNPDSDQQDIIQVAQILLNRSATKEIRYVQLSAEEQKKEQAKLDKEPKTWIK